MDAVKKFRLHGGISESVKAPQKQSSILNVESLSFDFSKMGEESFDVDAFVRNMLQKLPNEEAVQNLQRSLQESKETISFDLQRNVYKNYNEFVVISKEISKLEGDMASVRRVLGELKEHRERFKAYAQEDAQQAQAEEKAQTNRQRASQRQTMTVSKDDMAKLKLQIDGSNDIRVAQMKAMYKDFESLPKALPDNPTRQLILDGNAMKIFEINPISLKQKDAVFLHILSDSFVVAVLKKNLISGKSKMSVDKVIPIMEIGYIDIKDSSELNNAFKIIRGAETFMYRTETLSEKKAFAAAISQWTGEIVAQKKQDIVPKSTGLSGPLLAKNSAPIKLKTKKVQDDGLADNDYRWLLELSDELDVLIAQRDFRAAITHIERARQIMSACPAETPRLSILRSNIDERVTALSRLISMDLISPAATKSQIQDDIERLLKLGLGDRARDIYLTSRSQNIKHRLRQLQFNGDILSYMIDYSEVFFRLIRNTCEWFSVSFSDPSMASGFMKWIHEELTEFSSVFIKQTFHMQHSFQVIADCVITATERTMDLNSIGLDLTSTFESMIRSDLIAAIEDHAYKCDMEIIDCIKRDKFDSLDPAVELFESSNVVFDVAIPPLSQSALDFYEVLSMFGSDIGTLMSFSLYNTIVTSLRHFFCTYVDNLRMAVESPKGSILQHVTLLCNAKFVVEKILPTTESQLQGRFERQIPELVSAMSELRGLLYKTNFVVETLAAIREVSFRQLLSKLNQDYNFETMDYSNTAQIVENILPTNSMITFSKSLLSIEDDTNMVIHSKELIQELITIFFNNILDSAANWTTPKGPRKIGFGGIQSFLLDMNFFLAVFETYVSEEINEKSNAICEKALKAYFGQNPNVKTPLKNGEFYDARTQAALKKYCF